MTVKIKVEPSIQEMMEELRQNHIDVSLTIQEELPQYITDIIINLYNTEVKHE